jgi:GH24 family phage-related lysozyme (muramidase)
MPQVNQAGIDLIEEFEGCELTAYQDSGGVWTIGYGHTPAKEGEAITQAEADELLEQDLAYAASDVQTLTQTVLTPNQFAALVSFEYNTGALATSPGLALINERQFEAAWDDHFCLFIHDASGNTLEGLVRRRVAERALFFSVA